MKPEVGENRRSGGSVVGKGFSKRKGKKEKNWNGIVEKGL